MGAEDEESKDPRSPNIINSEHYNPLTNMKYKEREQGKPENTLEVLAVPSFAKLPIETKEPQDFLAFAQNLNEILTDLTNKTEERPKSFYFTLYLLNQFIESKKNERRKN